MRFQKFGDRLIPCGPEANEWYANAKDGDSINLQPEKRTTQQNSAIHKYCSMLAEALNGAGFDQRTYPYREGFSIPWTTHSVKEIFWKRTQKHLLGKDSTTKLDTKEVNQVFEVVHKGIADNTGIHIDFPSQESMRDAA